MLGDQGSILIEPESIDLAHTQISVGIEEEADDGGEFYYSLDGGTDNTIKLALDVSGGISNYDINLNADFTGISTANNPDSAPIGFRDNWDADEQTWTPFILAGDSSTVYIGNNPLDAWMTALRPYIGCQNLQQITVSVHSMVKRRAEHDHVSPTGSRNVIGSFLVIDADLCV